jgi:hypothetical protein
MSYMKFELHHQKEGSLVETTLSGVESDVFLVDSANLQAFECGGSFRYIGGHFKSSPVTLRVPTSANWTAVVIPQLGGTVRASVRVLAA